ncbi:hypothetical protein AXF42_Ash011541 [Apostasia shenzhenica]|uniref:RNA polymerase-associated protein LEO1 n=1 Tax=Apostasia shenzhenica TaxID=1088818 RepID=A0A2I0BAZ8_9ASPA|nr:hypothetical protein AXF42_Ash011541 [Apostasia shenzhenica]
MGRDRETEEETRNQMMQNLFGDQSEEEDEEEEVNSEHEAAANHSDYHSEDVDIEADIEGDGERDVHAEGEDHLEGQGEVEVESDGEAEDIDIDGGESEGGRVQSSPEREASDERVESESKYGESEEEAYGQRVATSRRREVISVESEDSEESHHVNPGNEDDEVENTRNISRSPDEQKDNEVVRDVFGESDEDEQVGYVAQNDLDQEQESHRSPVEEDGDYERDLRPEDVVPDEDAEYASEDENLEQKMKEKPIGPPLEMDIPLRLPPGRPDQVTGTLQHGSPQSTSDPPSHPYRFVSGLSSMPTRPLASTNDICMNMIRVSNIMGIEPKPFDPKTYVEEDVFVTDESGTKKRIRLEDNIVRWRTVKNRDGTTTVLKEANHYESNARFVQWSDGSLQLLIGNEVLDISVQEADHDQAHLFLRHGKGILQSQGRLLRKMRFMPSSLSSKSHRLLTALVDSRHKKVYKVKNCITDIDPEREKGEKQKEDMQVESQMIRANEQLNRKREKVTRKYSQPVNKGRQLSPGFLEDALDEEDEPDDYYSARRFSARRRFEEDLEAEAEAEKLIINAKRPNFQRGAPRKQSVPAERSSRRPVEEYSASEREESEYESEGEDIVTSPHAMEPDNEDEYEEDAREDAAGTDSASDQEEPRQNVRETAVNSLKRKDIDSDEDSPRRKAPMHRRAVLVMDSDDE